jgi:hypothetical protein
MKRFLLVMLTALALLQLACYKDKGNYDYHPVVAPGIANLDTLYKVAVGDTLLIDPQITAGQPNARLGLSWRLSVPLKVWDTMFTGNTFKYRFLLEPDTYPVRLTITDSANGMQYFRNFNIQVITPYSLGTVVLSEENNTSQLSFIQPDGTVLPHIYQTLNGGAQLPGKPLQLIDLIKQQVSPVPALGYWITNDDAIDGGTHIGNNTLVKINTLRTNFFDMPPAAKAGYFETTENGVLRGVLNGKAYEGAWQTFYGADIYGYFGAAVNGDYELYPRIVFNNQAPLIVMGYEKNRKQFVAFTNMGGLSYLGTNYQVTDITPFDPKNVQLDLLYFHQVGGADIYAFGKAADGTLYDLKFQTQFMGFVQITPAYKQAFPQPSLITPTTIWAGNINSGDVFYFTSGDKIYSYTPSNKQIIPLTTDFGGKNVTMLKMADNDNTLIAGVEGSLYFLDVSTGVFGNVIKKIDGIPGDPVDVVVKK